MTRFGFEVVYYMQKSISCTYLLAGMIFVVNQKYLGVEFIKVDVMRSKRQIDHFHRNSMVLGCKQQLVGYIRKDNLRGILNRVRQLINCKNNCVQRHLHGCCI